MSEENADPQVEAEVTEVAEVPAVESADDRAARFNAAINGEEKPRDDEGRYAKTEQPPADDPSPSEESVAVDQQVSEGPSPYLLEAAKAFLDDEDIEACQSDQELAAAIRVAKRFQTPQSAETDEQPPAAPFAFEWSDEDVPKDDPYRKEIERAFAHLLSNQEILAKAELEQRERLTSRESLEMQAREEANQKQFDKLLDEAAIEGFGKSDKYVAGKSPEWQRRNQEYATYANLTQLGFTPEQAIQAIALKAGKPVQQQQQQPPAKKDALLKQSKSRLGGGPSRPLASPPPSREERWAERMNTLN